MINLSDLRGVRSEFLFRDGNTAFTDRDNSAEELLEQLNVGDQVSVSGSITSSTPLTVNAAVVRDSSITVPRTRPEDEGDATSTPPVITPTSTVGTTTVSTSTSGGTPSSSFLASIQAALNAIIQQLQHIRDTVVGHG